MRKVLIVLMATALATPAAAYTEKDLFLIKDHADEFLKKLSASRMLDIKVGGIDRTLPLTGFAEGLAEMKTHCRAGHDPS